MAALVEEKKADIVKEIQRCDIYELYNALQFNWMGKHFFDIRTEKDFNEYHLFESINIPFTHLLEAIANVKSDNNYYNINDKQEEIIKTIANSVSMGVTTLDVSTYDTFIRKSYDFYFYSDQQFMKNANKENTREKQCYGYLQNIIEILQNTFKTQINMTVLECGFEQFYHKFPFLCSVAASANAQNDNNNENIQNDKANTDVNDDDDLKDDDDGDDGNEGQRDEAFDLFKLNAYPNQILNDKLFLGDIDHANSAKILENLKITHVVNATPMKNPFENNPGFDIKYIQCAIADWRTAKIELHFERVIAFIDNALDKEEQNNNENRVLVHCMAGVSRSSSLIIAYLMKKNQSKYDETFDFVLEKRPIINPNVGFRQKLISFAENGYKVDKSDNKETTTITLKDQLIALQN